MSVQAPAPAIAEGDRKAGKIIVALATDLPDVPQQAKELEANFFPIAKILHAKKNEEGVLVALLNGINRFKVDTW